jgi:hypothetical protein
VKIKKMNLTLACITLIFLFTPALVFAQSDSGINSGNQGLHLRGALGAGKIFWGYISYGSGSGDLGTGEGANMNLAALYNYSILGVEANFQTGNISNLKWTDKDSSNIEHHYTSTGSGDYTIFDLKLGAKLFTSAGDMGYTYFFVGKRFWNTTRKQDSLEYDGVKYASSSERKAKGDGWIFGYRDFSTLGSNNGLALAIQSGLFFGKAPVSKMSTDGVDNTYPVKSSVSIGGELGAGIALQNLGFSVIGGFRGEINVTTFNDSSAPASKESVFGFGNALFFVEAGMMF